MKFRSLVLAVLAMTGVAPALVAQDMANCVMVPQEQTHMQTVKLPSGKNNAFFGGSVVVRCPAKKLVLKSDSAEIYGDEQRVFLVGHVDYKEPRLALTSDFLTYYMADERVVAAGNVHAKLPNGSTMEGQQGEYRRAAPRIRPRAQLNAFLRPTVNIVQRDAAGKPEPPLAVTANTIFMDGDSLLYAGGQVVITRPELVASGDSVFIDTGKEFMHLMRGPKLDGKGQSGQRPFTLTGELIDLFSKQRKLQRVISRGKAVATSQELTLRSDTIDLHVQNDLLERADAWGKSRARATSTTQTMLADSIFVAMPRQRVREVRAFRQAYAAGKPDTTHFHTDPKEKSDSTDWLRGDTIVAYFDTLPHAGSPRDTAKAPDIRELVALGNARSYYHLTPTDTTTHRFAISYTTSRMITIHFDEQRVASVTAQSDARGVYLEPTGDSTKARPRTAVPLPTPGRPPGAVGGSPPGGRRP